MAFPKPEDYKTHTGPTGSPTDWAKKAYRVTKGVRKADTKALRALEVLGLTEMPTDPRVLKRAYKQASLKCHPDQGGAAEDFRNVQIAYDVLSNLIDP
jgi:DnaJ-class molecular chaperone